MNYVEIQWAKEEGPMSAQNECVCAKRLNNEKRNKQFFTVTVQPKNACKLEL